MGIEKVRFLPSVNLNKPNKKDKCYPQKDKFLHNTRLYKEIFLGRDNSSTETALITPLNNVGAIWSLYIVVSVLGL